MQNRRIKIAPKSKIEMTYDEAILYCRFLEYDGYNDWRMPTEEEWICTSGMFDGWYINRNLNRVFQRKNTVQPVRYSNIEFAPQSTKSMLYEDALLYCQFLEYNGRRDWRLPTKVEVGEWYLRSWSIDNNHNTPHYKERVIPVRDV